MQGGQAYPIRKLVVFERAIVWGDPRFCRAYLNASIPMLSLSEYRASLRVGDESFAVSISRSGYTVQAHRPDETSASKDDQI